MKILLINNQHHRKGGAHAVYLNTAELLKKHGHEVFFFALKDEKTLSEKYVDFFPGMVQYRDLSLFNKIKSVKTFVSNTKAAKKLEQYIQLIKPDIAHVHLFMGGLTISILQILKKNNIPVVHSVHDYRLICPAYLLLNGKNEVCEKCKNGRYYQCITNKCSENSLSQSTILALDAYARKWHKNPYKYLDSLIFVSHFALSKHKEFGLPEKTETHVLYNFIPELNKCIPQYQRGEYFLFLGRLSREKGILTLMEAVGNEDVKLKILGTGPLFGQVKKQKTDNVEFLGFKQGEELIQIIKNAGFIIVPSEWYENNPMSIIEAYTWGKPVIGADIGGIPEIVVSGETGYLFSPQNSKDLQMKIQTAAQLTNSQYETLSRNARKFAESHFNPDDYIIELINIYKKLTHD